jgi:hypothetical protein
MRNTNNENLNFTEKNFLSLGNIHNHMGQQGKRWKISSHLIENNSKENVYMATCY